MKEQVAVKAVIIKDDTFLLLKQSVDGKTYYTLPGGRVTGSDLEIELKREIKEETNLDVEPTQYIGEWFFIREKDNTKTLCKTYLCKLIYEKNIATSNSEVYEQILDFVWVTKEQFIHGEFTSNQSLLDLVSKTSAF